MKLVVMSVITLCCLLEVKGEGQEVSNNYYFQEQTAAPNQDYQQEYYCDGSNYQADNAGGLAEEECYCTYEPRYFKVWHCDWVEKSWQRKHCQYVPQYYEQQCVRYVPEYYTVTNCCYVPQYYYTTECCQVPKYYSETFCYYEPRYYYPDCCCQE